MDPQVQASFIPKRSLETGASRGGGLMTGLFFLLALLIFIASLVAAGGAFTYEKYLQKAILDKSKSLQLSEGAYDPGVIQDLIRLDARIGQAQKLLQKHVAASAIFNFLGTQTLEKVAFTTFDYSLQPDGTAKITLDGEADSFSTLALQSDQLGANKLLKNVIFSNVNVAQNGRINFSVDATVDPSLLLFKNSVGAVAPDKVTPPAPTTNATTDANATTKAPTTPASPFAK